MTYEKNLLNHIFKLIMKLYETKYFWYWNRLTDKRNRIQRPETDPSVYKKLIYHQGDISNQWGKDGFNK